MKVDNLWVHWGQAVNPVFFRKRDDIGGSDRL